MRKAIPCTEIDNSLEAKQGAWETGFLLGYRDASEDKDYNEYQSTGGGDVHDKARRDGYYAGFQDYYETGDRGFTPALALYYYKFVG